jgi:hypothetical protein
VAGDQTAVYGATLPDNTWSLGDEPIRASPTQSVLVTYDYWTPGVCTLEATTSFRQQLSLPPGLDSNYDITYVNGTIVITKATLTVNLDNASSNWVKAHQPSPSRAPKV